MVKRKQLPKMKFVVETYSEGKIIRHDVPDAIDFEDAEYVVSKEYPFEKIISVIKLLD